MQDEVKIKKATLQSISVLLLKTNLFGGAQTEDADFSRGASNYYEFLWERCYEEGKVKAELIREVDLGPFKHKVDEGLPVRKLWFNVMVDLINSTARRDVSGFCTYLFNSNAATPTPATATANGNGNGTFAPPARGNFQSFIADGLADWEDVQQVACQILTDLALVNFAQQSKAAIGATGEGDAVNLWNFLERIIEPLGRAIEKYQKQIQSKQNITKAMDMLRVFARCIKAIMWYMKEHPDSDLFKTKLFTEFVNRLNKDPTFYAAYEN